MTELSLRLDRNRNSNPKCCFEFFSVKIVFEWRSQKIIEIILEERNIVSSCQQLAPFECSFEYFPRLRYDYTLKTVWKDQYHWYRVYHSLSRFLARVTQKHTRTTWTRDTFRFVILTFAPIISLIEGSCLLETRKHAFSDTFFH